MTGPQRPDWTHGPARLAPAAALIILAGLLTLSAAITDRTAIADRTPAQHFISIRLNINTTTAADLEMLPTIGPKRAAAIIASRTTDGPFTTIDNLQRVPGIGPRTVNRIRPYLVPLGADDSPAR